MVNKSLTLVEDLLAFLDEHEKWFDIGFIVLKREESMIICGLSFMTQPPNIP